MMSVVSLLLKAEQLSTAQLYLLLVKINTMYAKRVKEERREALAEADKIPARLVIDSSRERT